MRTIEWISENNTIRMIDQPALPGRLVFQEIHSAEAMAEAISHMVIRGAPALAVAGAFGIALKAIELKKHNSINWRDQLNQSAEILIATRPTAVNLAWGVNRVMRIANRTGLELKEVSELILQDALAMAEEDVTTNLRLAMNGASLINDRDVILHHCNTGALAGVDWGTALGAIRYAHQSGKKVKVLVDETRPRLQGSRLTAWECEQYGIPYEIITDNAAGFFLQHGLVNAVFFGADRVAANGDVVNKIGTYMLSLAAKANDVPVYSVFPTSTVDLTVKSGWEIKIEERDPNEVLGLKYQGEEVAPSTAKARNPAFDITPNEMITAWITENQIVYPPFELNFNQPVYNLK